MKNYIVEYRDGEISAVIPAASEEEAIKKFLDGNCTYKVSGFNLWPEMVTAESDGEAA